jgi:hypothetical protein
MELENYENRMLAGMLIAAATPLLFQNAVGANGRDPNPVGVNGMEADK